MMFTTCLRRKARRDIERNSICNRPFIARAKPSGDIYNLPFEWVQRERLCRYMPRFNSLFWVYNHSHPRNENGPFELFVVPININVVPKWRLWIFFWFVLHMIFLCAPVFQTENPSSKRRNSNYLMPVMTRPSGLSLVCEIFGIVASPRGIGSAWFSFVLWFSLAKYYFKTAVASQNGTAKEIFILKWQSKVALPIFLHFSVFFLLRKNTQNPKNNMKKWHCKLNIYFKWQNGSEIWIFFLGLPF
jgi:hypothetical protein